MEENNDTYVLINIEKYEKNKKNILKSLESLLVILKSIHTLKVLSRKRNNLKKKLYKTSSKVIVDIDSLMGKLPKPYVPEKFKKTSEEDEETEERKHRDIEAELKLIRDKLKRLNNQF